MWTWVILIVRTLELLHMLEASMVVLILPSPLRTYNQSKWAAVVVVSLPVRFLIRGHQVCQKAKSKSRIRMAARPMEQKLRCGLHREADWNLTLLPYTWAAF